MRYSNSQRIGFIGILMGFLMCAIGCFPPYWKAGSISIDYFISIKMLDIKAGLWIFCVKVLGIEEECHSTLDVVDTLHDISSRLHIKDSSQHWLVIIYAASGLCLTLSLACGLAACCRVCCCTGGKTMCHGIMAFLAGAFGFVVVAVFSLRADEMYGLSVLDLDYGWAFYLFTAGSAILVMSSFLLCCATPQDNTYQLMTTPAMSMPVVIAQTSTSSQMNAASYPPAQVPVMYREMETRPIVYEYEQSASQPNKY